MHLETQRHEAKLTALSRAFKNISTRCQNTETRGFWQSQKQLAEILLLAVEDFHRLKPSAVKIFHKLTGDLAIVTEALIDRTSTPAGKQFWANQSANLLILSDHLSDRLVTKKETLSDHAHQN